MAFSVSTRVTGGEKLAKVLRGLSQSESTAMVKRIEMGMRRELLPRLSAGVGRQSGALAKSFDLRAKGDSIELTSNVHYSRQAKFRNRRPDNTVALAHQIASRQIERIVRRAQQG